jgi:hypothetical protein
VDVYSGTDVIDGRTYKCILIFKGGFEALQMMLEPDKCLEITITIDFVLISIFDVPIIVLGFWVEPANSVW